MSSEQWEAKTEDQQKELVAYIKGLNIPDEQKARLGELMTDWTSSMTEQIFARIHEITLGLK